MQSCLYFMPHKWNHVKLPSHILIPYRKHWKKVLWTTKKQSHALSFIINNIIKSSPHSSTPIPLECCIFIPGSVCFSKIMTAAGIYAASGSRLGPLTVGEGERVKSGEGWDDRDADGSISQVRQQHTQKKKIVAKFQLCRMVELLPTIKSTKSIHFHAFYSSHPNLDCD